MDTRLPLWVMLSALTAVFALSHAFRTVPTIVAGQIQPEFGVSSQALGLFAASFHLAFGAMQLVMGIVLDRYGPRLTVSVVFVIAILGAVVSAYAPSFSVLVVGQLLIGVGCAPAFLATLVFLARNYPSNQFTKLSGLVLGIGGLGMLITGTPLAWVVQNWSWREAFLVLAVGSAMTWLATVVLVSDGKPAEQHHRETLGETLRQVGAILAERHTIGIVILGAVTYAAFMTLRGLWAVPMLVARDEFNLVQSGHIILAASIFALFGPPIFGRLDPGDRTRRQWIIGFTAAFAALFVILAVRGPSFVDVGLFLLSGLLAGFMVLQYADVRTAYSDKVVGRALAVFNMSMFLGVALMQWASGLIASVAIAYGVDPLRAVFAGTAAILITAVVAFHVLPAPDRMQKTS